MTKIVRTPMDIPFIKSSYRRAILGAYSFMYMPVTLPHRHSDNTELLITNEHEQLHQSLAHQTTHGYGALFANSFLEINQLKQEEIDEIERRLLDMLEGGKAIHERYTTYSTLYTNPSYHSYLQQLPEEYKVYLQEAVELVPESIVNLRIGRIFVYACVLNALSPPVLLDEGPMTPIEALLDYLRQIGNCEERWERILHWRRGMGRNEISEIRALATGAGYTPFEVSLPIYYRDSIRLLDNSEERFQVLHNKESLFTELLVIYIGQKTQPEKAQPVTISELKRVIGPFRDLIVPHFKLVNTFAEEIGMDVKTYAEVNQLFQENPIVGYTEVSQNTHLALTAPDAARIMHGVYDLPYNFHCIGYIGSDLESRLAEKFLKHLHPLPDIFVQLTILAKKIDYGKVIKMEKLYIFDTEAWMEIASTSEKLSNLIYFVSPFIMYEDKKVNAIVNQLLKLELRLYVIQATGFLDLLKWRRDNGLSITSVQVSIYGIKGALYYLAKTRFVEEEIYHAHLCTESTIRGLYRLKKMQGVDLQILSFDCFELSDDHRAVVDFLLLYQRKGFLGG